MICGGWMMQHGSTDPFLSALPRLVHVEGERDGTGAWLDGTLALLEREVLSSRPGADSVVTRLSEVIFIQALRTFLEQTPHGQTGWIDALADPAIAVAVGLIVRQPGRRWSVPDLARASGMSRSGFASRFRQKTGETPMQFLSRWRLSRASLLLRETERSIADIAQEVGYESEVGFAKAFSRFAGAPPARYRQSPRVNGPEE
jgi:transcriptional regulator GlxA family with amidase domain